MHFKQSFVFPRTCLYTQKEQSRELYKKPNKLPYECADILLFVVKRVPVLPQIGLNVSLLSWRQPSEGVK